MEPKSLIDDYLDGPQLLRKAVAGMSQEQLLARPLELHAPGLEHVTGLYFASSKPKRSSKASYDEKVAARLWQVSADLVGSTTTDEH